MALGPRDRAKSRPSALEEGLAIAVDRTTLFGTDNDFLHALARYVGGIWKDVFVHHRDESAKGVRLAPVRCCGKQEQMRGRPGQRPPEFVARDPLGQSTQLELPHDEPRLHRLAESYLVGTEVSNTIAGHRTGQRVDLAWKGNDRAADGLEEQVLGESPGHTSRSSDIG